MSYTMNPWMEIWNRLKMTTSGGTEMAKEYSRNFIESVKLELLTRLGLKQVYYKGQAGDDLLYEATGFDRGSVHKFCVRTKKGTVDEMVAGKWMKVRSFEVKSKEATS
jgi:hypothetical protein